MKKLIHNKLVWFCLIIVGILVVNFYQTKQKNEVAFAKQSSEEIVEKKDEDIKESSTPVKSKVFMVDVKGAIQKPGVIQCKEGERVFDAIRLAGGFSDKADVNKVNLAEKIVDEMVIYVPFFGEEMDQISFNKEDESIENEKIDINHASQSELEKIPGVGPTKAKNILDYIENNGPFTSVEQLDDVNGIGKKSLEQMTPFIIIR
ncbi:helix-hairpin-helix domain-containing protein [Bacillus sp. AFS041924]|uniref:helix-hairpin-helix domain-containing protein n=1 Tax=Bacillus sp. AFS041924 TaxID=2033503 RepID=UPI000BFE5438|nr:helix-hairpin-helix domain-containing protein [Bacillus sp. AFS041924]PGS48978.1 competence protein ComE [Bacillus sp. AFS041924]